MNEKISEIIDHRGTPRQRQSVFDHILADDGARRAWQRYHLIGCVLRGEVRQTGMDLSARIRTRLEREPTTLAPVPARATPWKSAGMLALAASIALAAVIIFHQAGEEDGTNRIVDNSHGARFEQAFGEMLAQHGEFTSSPGLNGLVVYAKLVSNAPIER